MIKPVTRDGGVRHQVYGRRAGRKVYVGTFESKREAEAAERRFAVTQEQIAAGELPAELDLKRTLSEAAAAWLTSLEQRGSRSHKSYGNSMSLYVLPQLGTVAIARMTKGHVMRWRDELARRFSPATVNGALTALQSALSYFIDREWLEKNPAHGVDRVERPDRLYAWIESREEITRLLAQCVGDHRDIIALALGTGMRLDEILHLEWTDIDLDRRLLAVHRGRQGTVKSGKARRIPILDTLLPLLRARALQRGGAELVFPGAPGKFGAKAKPRSKPGVGAAYKLALKRAGLDKKLRFHDLRHTFASHWVLDGGDIFRLSKILGHSSVTITQKVYAHLAPEAWEQDYHRVAFHIPTETVVHRFARADGGRITGRDVGPAAASKPPIALVR